MKFILYFICFNFSLAISGELKAQTYKPVLDSDTIQWNYLTDNHCGDCIYTSIIKVYGDTLINTEHYRNVYQKSTDYGEYNLIGFIREDTISGKMIMLSFSAQCQDVPCYVNTVYDMSLKKNDVLEFYSDLSTAYFQVSNIDTIEGRKIISFANNELSFIEGIGATRELTLEGFQNGLSELLCEFENGENFFHRKVLEFDTCYIPLNGTGIEIGSTDEFKVYPNPAGLDQNIQFKTIKSEKIQLKIYSITGSLLYSKEYKGSFAIAPNDFTKAKGLFIYHLNYSDSPLLRAGILIIN